MNIPIGLETKNVGIIDLLTEMAIYFDEPQGLVLREENIPKEMVAEAKDRRAEMIGAFNILRTIRLNFLHLFPCNKHDLFTYLTIIRLRIIYHRAIKL